MYEHPVPVSPFEERFGSDIGKNNGNMNIQDLKKMTSKVTTGKSNNNDNTTISSGRTNKKSSV
jgi:hypothetical protein